MAPVRWLLSAIIASYLSERKGYGEKPGLASGLLLHVVGVIIWLVWPAKPNSKWKTIGPVRPREVLAPARGGEAPSARSAPPPGGAA